MLSGRRALTIINTAAAQSDAAQHSTAQHSTAQHSTAQHSTAQHSTAQHRHSTAQHEATNQLTKTPSAASSDATHRCPPPAGRWQSAWAAPAAAPAAVAGHGRTHPGWLSGRAPSLPHSARSPQGGRGHSWLRCSPGWSDPARPAAPTSCVRCRGWDTASSWRGRPGVLRAILWRRGGRPG